MSDQIRITPERLAASPSLLGTPPQNLSFAPEGEFVVFRGPDPEDRERYNLYRIDLDTMQQSLWLDSRDLKSSTSDVTELTAEERAQRERRRDFSHGITSFHWRPKHREILLPVDGQAYLVSMDTPSNPRPLFPDQSRQLGFAWSPNGRYLSFVRDRDLYFLDVERGVETRVTDDASDVVQSGLPDFLAAEEMHRFTGHWWSADESQLFYTRTDESPVAISHRLEIDATGANTIAQRYPYAGQTNPLVELWVFATHNGSREALYSTDSSDDYLARCFPVTTGTFFLIQDRQQQSLQYIHQQGSSSLDTCPVYFAEQSDSWINLHEDLLEQGDVYITSDETHGPRQLLEFAQEGEITRYDCITHLNRILYADEARILVTGWTDNPTENHLYEVDRQSRTARQLTQAPGWHDVALNHEGTAFVDRFSNINEPLTIEYTQIAEHSCSRGTIYAQRGDPEHPYTEYMDAHITGTIGSMAASDGQTLWYRITPPADLAPGQTYPSILYVYGGPGAQKVRNEWNSNLNQMFAQHGLGVIEIDNRGSTNRGRQFEAPLYLHMGGVEIEDQAKCFDLLQECTWADPDRVGVFGHSYGGYMSLMLLCQKENLFAAGVAVAPVCDWRLYDTHYTERYMSTPEANPDGYAAGNVKAYLHRLSSPLLLMHGMADDNVLFTNTTMIMDELQKLNKDFDLMTYPGAKHSMQEPAVTVHRFSKILKFFQTHLLDK